MQNWITTLFQQYGIAGLMFLVFYLYHNSTIKQFQMLLEQSQELTKNQQETSKSNFDLLKDMIEVNLLQNTKLQRIEDLILNNRFCPYVQKHFNSKNAQREVNVDA